ncbi:MAG: Hin recombinase [Clostridiales bacterium]|nr:Hin recombinase [Clostridiales bacterium]
MIENIENEKQRILYLEQELKMSQEREKKLEERVNRLKCQINRLQKNEESECKKHAKGRPSLSLAKKQTIWKLRQQGSTVRQIAEQTNVSVGAVSNVIREYQNRAEMLQTKQILYYMNREEICTKIYVDFSEEKIEIKNETDDVLYRAFGCKEHPDWADFEFFLEDRCFPRTRDKMKLILKDLGLQSYDPWQIVQKTQGRMAGDYQWIKFVEEEDDRA